MKAHEEVQLNNFKAQKDSILTEIRVAADRLSGILGKTEEADKKHTSVRNKIASASKEHEAILASSKDRMRVADIRDAKTEEGAAKLEEDKAAFAAHQETERNKLAAESAAFEENMRERQDMLAHIIEITPEMQATLDSISKAADEGKLVFMTLQAEQRTWEEASTKERTDATLELAGIRKEREAEQQLLTDTKAQVREEILKIGEPEKKIRRDYAAFALKERNLEVYADRVKAAYKELYPDRPFII